MDLTAANVVQWGNYTESRVAATRFVDRSGQIFEARTNSSDSSDDPIFSIFRRTDDECVFVDHIHPGPLILPVPYNHSGTYGGPEFLPLPNLLAIPVGEIQVAEDFLKGLQAMLPPTTYGEALFSDFEW
jgi:hypothetical protein